ncbi:TPA: hypothetical protein ACXH6M_000520 [Neisseria meningitidis]
MPSEPRVAASINRHALFVIPTKTETLKFRHSYESGNPVCSVSVVFGFRVISKSSFPRRRESSPWGSGNIYKAV